jgi:PAS domain S-box-containing protein
MHQDRALRRSLGGLALALVAPAIALGMRHLPGPDLGPPYLLLCPPILVAALVGGPWSGFLSTVLSTLITAAWVLSGRGASGVSPRDAVSLAAFLGSGLLVTQLAHLHRQARDRAASAEQAAALRETRARLEAQAAVRIDAERQRLAVTLQCIGDAVIATDVGGRITDLNIVAERLTGWPAAEALGRPLSEVFRIIAEDTGAPAEDPAARVLRQGIVVGLANHTVLVARDGTRWPIADSAAPIRTADGEIIGVVLVFRDQSEERRAEQAQKLETVGRLAGGIAHDFNNILTVILAGVSELRRTPDDRSTVVEIVEEIGAAGSRARELTQRLLAFARKQVIAPITLDMSAVVQGAEKLLRRLLGEHVVLTTRLAPDLWQVRCDRSQVEHIIVNLAVNARDAMPTGGRLSLATANVEVTDDDPGAAPAGLRPGRWVRLTVSDDGEGMTPEVRARIFEPFFTTKEEGKGTGLGLSTVYGIVTQNDGVIRVDSALGRGTSFDIFLPEAAGAPAASPFREDAPRPGTETILVVEDDAQVRAVTVRTLRSAGYQVLVAGGGEEALELSARASGHVHLLVTDMVMPGLSGRAVAERLTAERASLRVLYVSGYAQGVFDEDGALELGVEFLPKPFTPDALLERVRAVLDAPLPARSAAQR